MKFRGSLKYLVALIVLSSVLVSDRSSAWVHGSPAARTLNVVTRTQFPWLFGSTNKQTMGQVAVLAQGNATSVQAVFFNGYLDTSNNTGTYSEMGTGAPMTVTMGICSSINATTCTQFTCSGSTTCTVASGAFLTTDPLPFTLVKGTRYYHRIWTSSTAGIVYSTQGNATLGDRFRDAVSGLSDQTAGGTISNDNPGFFVPLTALIATTTGTSYCLTGESRTAGVIDSSGDFQVAASGDIGIVAPSIGVNSPYVSLGIPGDTVVHYLASHTARTFIVNNYCSAQIIASGGNDTQNAALLTNLQSEINLADSNIKVYTVTTDANTSSTDNWATTANQTILTNYATLNSFMLSNPSPVIGSFDVASISSAAGKWQVNGTANFRTADGLHNNTPSYVAILNSGIVSAP